MSMYRRGPGFSSQEAFLDDDESYYFSKKKLLPRRIPDSYFQEKFKKYSTYLPCFPCLLFLCGFLLFIIVLFLSYHFLSSLGPDSRGSAKVEHDIFHKQPNHDQSFDKKSQHNSDGNDIVVSFHNEEETLAFSNWRSGKNQDLLHRVDDLHRIRASVLTELRQLEKRREELRKGVLTESEKLDHLKLSNSKKEQELSNIESAIEQAKLAHKEAIQKQTPEIYLPPELHSESLPNKITVPKEKDLERCSMANCFDWSRCPINRGLTFYVYKPSQKASQRILKAYSLLEQREERTSIAARACIFIVLLETEKDLESLEFWDSGRNHLMINLDGDLNSSLKRSLAVLVDSAAHRKGFDILIPPVLSDSWTSDNIWENLPLLLPARRAYFLTFWGDFIPTGDNQKNQAVQKIIDDLKKIQNTKTDDRISIKISINRYDRKNQSSTNYIPGDWSLVSADQNRRLSLLKQSEFTMILPDSEGLLNGRINSSRHFLTRISEALLSGSIPVILGSEYAGVNVLPFDEYIDWSRFVVWVPPQRIGELHFILRSYSTTDFLEMKRQGRYFFENFLGHLNGILSVVLTSIRFKLQVPAIHSLAKEYKGTGVFPLGAKSPDQSQVTEMPIALDPEEYLGPVELPQPSQMFSSNFSQFSLYKYSLWNEVKNPVKMAPFLPERIPLPTESRFFEDTSMGFRSIGDGSGGSGKEFSKAIGGNYPREQFTIVVLTYERENVLVESLSRFNHLPYLNKIVVVWNSPKPPSPDILWPKLTAPLVVIRPDKNSLNNRFLPFEEIETEAVFSIDDDVHLTHAEIVFGFRVWREERDRIVGFPGRYHAWDGEHRSWQYNSNHSCELSMVLTGAAFYHKYYAYAYSNWMPQVIRDRVDELLNCEDLAMNYLVSHLTRKPPVKVTSKWTFRCPGCPETLSADETHYVERHECMQFLTKVYGYNPLLFTQFRVDSVLFKTRIPHNHQKCFKFI